MKKKHSAEFMAKVALATLKTNKTMAELSSEYEVHPTQLTRWRKRAIEGLVEIFKTKPVPIDKEKNVLVNELYCEIGKLRVENEWYKKKSEQF
ncbi:transposase IS3, partial [Candidatus Omnitrophus magneticus]